jgi:NAD(P)H-hydrate epimerase
MSVILDAVNDNDALAFGPGVGVSSELRRVLEAILEQQGLRLLIDADGLNNLARMKNWVSRVKAELILTPHPGEMKKLWSGLFREEMPGERQRQAVELAQHTGTVVVLKGAGTLVTDGENVYINRRATLEWQRRARVMF